MDGQPLGFPTGEMSKQLWVHFLDGRRTEYMGNGARSVKQVSGVDGGSKEGFGQWAVAGEENMRNEMQRIPAQKASMNCNVPVVAVIRSLGIN